MDVNSTNLKINPYLQDIGNGNSHSVKAEEIKNTTGVIGRSVSELPLINDAEILYEVYEMASESGMISEELHYRRKQALEKYQRIVSGNLFSGSSTENDLKTYNYLTPEMAATLLSELAIRFGIQQRRDAREFARQEREIRISLLEKAAKTHEKEAANLRTAASAQLAFGIVAGALAFTMSLYGTSCAIKATAKSNTANKFDENIQPPKFSGQDKLGASKNAHSSQDNRLTPERAAPESKTPNQKNEPKQSEEPSSKTHEVDPSEAKQTQKQQVDDEITNKAIENSSKPTNATKKDSQPEDIEAPPSRPDEAKAEIAELEAKARSYPIMGQGLSQMVSGIGGTTDTWLQAGRKMIEAERALLEADATYADMNEKEAEDFAQRMQEHATSMLDYLNRHLQAQVIRIRA